MLPAAVKSAMSKLDAPAQKHFKRDYNRRKKSIVICYLCWLLLGWHYLYMGKVGLQFAFWFTAGGFLVWWLIDAIRIPGIVMTHNADIARELMTQHKAMAT